jgi:hypothetical protein
MEHGSSLEPIRTTKDLVHPMKMKAQRMPQMPLSNRPCRECLQLGAEPGLLVSLMVPGKKIVKHGFPLCCRELPRYNHSIMLSQAHSIFAEQMDWPGDST